MKRVIVSRLFQQVLAEEDLAVALEEEEEEDLVAVEVKVLAVLEEDFLQVIQAEDLAVEQVLAGLEAKEEEISKIYIH